VSLQSDRGLKFHTVDNESLIAYSKTSTGAATVAAAAAGNIAAAGAALGDSVLVIANLDPHHTQTGWLELDLAQLGLPLDGSFQVHDLLSGARFLWRGPRNYVALDPGHSPAHIFRIRRRVRTERDFDYFL
jgi:starch synthase (maltosyl-transferring)